jgi:hypothetical protein
MFHSASSGLSKKLRDSVLDQAAKQAERGVFENYRVVNLKVLKRAKLHVAVSQMNEVVKDNRKWKMDSKSEGKGPAKDVCIAWKEVESIPHTATTTSENPRGQGPGKLLGSSLLIVELSFYVCFCSQLAIE